MTKWLKSSTNSNFSHCQLHLSPHILAFSLINFHFWDFFSMDKQLPLVKQSCTEWFVSSFNSSCACLWVLFIKEWISFTCLFGRINELFLVKVLVYAAIVVSLFHGISYLSPLLFSSNSGLKSVLLRKNIQIVGAFLRTSYLFSYIVEKCWSCDYKICKDCDHWCL